MNDKQAWTKPEPLWLADQSMPTFPTLEEDHSTDVCIVGGGITGITTGYLLAKAGKKVTLIDADKILHGTTGHTTAKITAQHGVIYNELKSHFGEENAALYYHSQMSALEFIEETVREHQVDCDFKKEDALLFATTEKGARKLEQENEAYQALGIPGGLTDRLPFDMDATKVLKMDGQARFHPVKFLRFLAEEIENHGGHIFEQTKATDVKEKERVEVRTGDGYSIRCDQLISCSHFPFYDGMGFYFSRMYAERSYLMAIKPEREIPEGMYLSIDEPSRSIRTAEYKGERVIIVGGENHKTGQGVEPSFHYGAIEEFAEVTFGIKEKLFQWSAQDLTTLDKVPYIGPITKNNDRVYVATGFRKWGMTNGTLAGHLLANYVLGEESLYHSLYEPSRFKADPSIKKFLSQNFDVAGHLIEGKVELVGDRPEGVRPGEGRVVQWRGERAGAYRSEEGELFLVDTTCTHMGCEVDWNDGEHTWDCPCHGSRFKYNGDVVEGPAKKPLTDLTSQLAPHVEEDMEHTQHEGDQL